jgi:hypothetical protein
MYFGFCSKGGFHEAKRMVITKISSLLSPGSGSTATAESEKILKDSSETRKMSSKPLNPEKPDPSRP